jgi:hypothetical protein
MDIPKIEKLRGNFINVTEEGDGYFGTHESGDIVQYDDAKSLHNAALFWKAAFEQGEAISKDTKRMATETLETLRVVNTNLDQLIAQRDKLNNDLESIKSIYLQMSNANIDLVGKAKQAKAIIKRLLENSIGYYSETEKEAIELINKLP